MGGTAPSEDSGTDAGGWASDMPAEWMWCGEEERKLLELYRAAASQRLQALILEVVRVLVTHLADGGARIP